MSLDELQRFRRQVSLQYGLEKEVISEEVVTQNKFRVYIRKARFEIPEEDVEVWFALRSDYSIAGMSLKPVEEDGGP